MKTLFVILGLAACAIIFTTQASLHKEKINQTDFRFESKKLLRTDSNPVVTEYPGVKAYSFIGDSAVLFTIDTMVFGGHIVTGRKMVAFIRPNIVVNGNQTIVTTNTIVYDNKRISYSTEQQFIIK